MAIRFVTVLGNTHVLEGTEDSNQVPHFCPPADDAAKLAAAVSGSVGFVLVDDSDRRIASRHVVSVFEV